MDVELKASDREAFIACVLEQGNLHNRNDLPWRFISDPYAVWISEAMLQQTQVSRVLRYWPAWMKQFPTVDALASASTSDVLESWQGLGYNRRALALKRAADICSAHWHGEMPTAYNDLLELPGIGPATAAGIRVFAYEQPEVYVETNVRTVYLHHFFKDARDPVSDKDIIPLVRATCNEADPRGWYYALLDYGHHLKKTHMNPGRNAKAYTKQSTFEGSHRQKRAFVVREVLASPGIDMAAVEALLAQHEQDAGRDAMDHAVFLELVETLAAEGFFKIEHNFLIP